MPTLSPVFKYGSLDAPVVFFQGRAISLRELLLTVDYLSSKIPAHQHLLNLYEDRYYFLLCFLLGLKKQTISLFPSTVTTHVISLLKESYQDLLVFSEPHSQSSQMLDQARISPSKNLHLEELLIDQDFSSNRTNTISDDYLYSIIPDIKPTQTTAIIFTSSRQ